MAIHTLEIMMKANTSEVMSGINAIESSVLKIVEQIKNLSVELSSALNLNAANAQNMVGGLKANTAEYENQLAALAELDVVLGSASKRVGEITDRNAQFAALQKNALDNAINMASQYKDVAGVQDKIAKARAVIENMERNSAPYQKKALDTFHKYSELLTYVANTKEEELSLTQDQLKLLQKIGPHVKNMHMWVKDIEKNTTLTNDQFENLGKNLSSVSENAQSFKNSVIDVKEVIGTIRNHFAAIDKLGDGLNFGSALTPLSFINSEMRNLNGLYEQNHGVNATFMADMYDSYNATSAMSEATRDAADGSALLGEAQEALTAILQSGQAAAVSSSQQMNELVRLTAETARATGLSAGEISNLTTRLTALSGSTERASELTDSLINVQTKGRLSASQMQQMTSLLTRDLGRLDKAYAIVGKDGKVVASGSVAIAAGMGAIAAAAAKAGEDADAAMTAMSRAIQDPMQMAALLGPALMENDPSKQFLMMGERADMFLGTMENMPPALQAAFAQKLGTTPAELRSLAAGTADYRKALEGVTDESERRAITEQFANKHRQEAADAEAAAAAKAEANASAQRNLQEAFDKFRIIFAQIASALQPVLDLLAAILSNPIARWAIIATGALMTLYIASTKIISGFSAVKNIFGSVGKTAQQMTSSVGGGSGGFAQSIKGFIETLGSISLGKAVKAAATLAIVGASLAVGVGLLGLALNLMPPDRTMELVASVAGIVAAGYVVSMMPANAIVGALVLAVVGAALAAGLALIGLALNLMPPDKTAELLIVMTGLVAASLVAALLAGIGPMALVGALTLLAVGAALAASIAMIGLAIDLMPPNKSEQLLVVLGTLLAAALISAGIGLVIAPALVGAVGMIAIASALAISIHILGTILGPARKAASAIMILSKAVSGISMTAGVALMMLSAGLVAFALAMGGAGVIGFFVDFTDMAEELGESMEILVDPIKSIAGLGSEAGDNLKTTADGISAFAEALDQGGFLGLFTPDFVNTANQLGASMNVLKEPIQQLAAIGPMGGVTFRSIGDGLNAMSEALSGGGIIEFFTGDKLENALQLGRAMAVLANPIERISAAGANAGVIFQNLGRGLKTISEAINEGVDSDDAEQLAQSLWRLAAPIDHFMRVQTNRQVEASGNVMRQQVQILAEEMRAGLAVQIEGGVSDRDDAIVEVLAEIRDILSVSTTDDEAVAELKKMNNVLTGIMGEMMMGSSLNGSSVADSRYNT